MVFLARWMHVVHEKKYTTLLHRPPQQRGFLNEPHPQRDSRMRGWECVPMGVYLLQNQECSAPNCKMQAFLSQAI